MTFYVVIDFNLVSMMLDHICIIFFSDGGNQQGGCLRNFRNRPYPVRVKVRYYENVLTVSLTFRKILDTVYFILIHTSKASTLMSNNYVHIVHSLLLELFK